MAHLTHQPRQLRKTRLVVSNEFGLHVRAAAMLVKIAESLDAQLTIQCGKHRANAKSIMSLLSLGVSKGTPICALAEGPKADEMIRAVDDLFARRFHEAAIQ